MQQQKQQKQSTPLLFVSALRTECTRLKSSVGFFCATCATSTCWTVTPSAINDDFAASPHHQQKGSLATSSLPAQRTLRIRLKRVRSPRFVSWPLWK